MDRSELVGIRLGCDEGRNDGHIDGLGVGLTDFLNLTKKGAAVGFDVGSDDGLEVG